MKTILTFLFFMHLNLFYCQCAVTLTYYKPFCTSCDGSITAVPSGSPPYTYQWSNGQTTSVLAGLCPSVYIVTMRDALNCVATESVSLSRLMSVSIGTTQPSCNSCCNGSATITITGGNPPFTYSNSCNTQSSNVINGLCWGSCNGVVMDNSGCGSGFLIELPVMVGLNDLEINNVISIFPNPFNHTAKINVHSNAIVFDIEIINSYGELVRVVRDIKNASFELNKEKLSSGLYTLIVTSNKRIIGKKKMIIVD